MSKSQKYIELVDELRKMACQPVVLIDEAAVDGEVVQMMRELRQFIERFRRLNEGGDAPVKFLKREEIARLGRDELAFIVDSFWDWYNENECPAERCDDYFCHYCQDVKERADEELADGDMNAEDYNHLAKTVSMTGCVVVRMMVAGLSFSFGAIGTVMTQRQERRRRQNERGKIYERPVAG